MLLNQIFDKRQNIRLQLAICYQSLVSINKAYFVSTLYNIV